MAKNKKNNTKVAIFAILTTMFATLFSFGLLDLLKIKGINPTYIVSISGIGLFILIYFGLTKTINSVSCRK